jgi:hypothetical protein
MSGVPTRPSHVAIRLHVALMLLLAAVPARSQDLQDLRVGIIDFYGLRQVSESQARDALRIVEGDRVPNSVTEPEQRVAALPGVLSARVSQVCCDGGRAILYVGIEERGSPVLRFRSAPHGRIRLSEDIVQARDDFNKASLQAILHGDAGEDHSEGHALMHDPAARAIQERFIVAARDLSRLRDVLRHSSDEEHRALAAQVLGYAVNKRAVIGDLVYGMDDPSEQVRNNSARALWIIATFASGSPDLKIRIPTKPFIRLLNSPVWSDLNKTSLALMELSGNRDPALLRSIREQALGSLVQMARWKSEGHAMPALMILGRIGGWSDEDIQSASMRCERETVVNAALKRR